ncbi:MAG: hypothetical protein ACKO37_02320 [Vampirovibrionales bacterium]
MPIFKTLNHLRTFQWVKPIPEAKKIALPHYNWAETGQVANTCFGTYALPGLRRAIERGAHANDNFLRDQSLYFFTDGLELTARNFLYKYLHEVQGIPKGVKLSSMTHFLIGIVKYPALGFTSFAVSQFIMKQAKRMAQWGHDTLYSPNKLHPTQAWIRQEKAQKTLGATLLSSIVGAGVGGTFLQRSLKFVHQNQPTRHGWDKTFNYLRTEIPLSIFSLELGVGVGLLLKHVLRPHAHQGTTGKVPVASASSHPMGVVSSSGKPKPHTVAAPMQASALLRPIPSIPSASTRMGQTLTPLIPPVKTKALTGIHALIGKALQATSKFDHKIDWTIFSDMTDYLMPMFLVFPIRYFITDPKDKRDEYAIRNTFNYGSAAFAALVVSRAITLPLLKRLQPFKGDPATVEGLHSTLRMLSARLTTLPFSIWMAVKLSPKIAEKLHAMRAKPTPPPTLVANTPSTTMPLTPPVTKPEVRPTRTQP